MKFPLHGKAILHGLGHAGLTAIAVGAFVWPLLPPPFNVIVGGGALGANFALGYFGKKTAAAESPLVPVVEAAAKTAQGKK